MIEDNIRDILFDEIKNNISSNFAKIPYLLITDNILCESCTVKYVSADLHPAYNHISGLRRW